MTGSAAVMDTDSDRFSPLQPSAFKAVPGLLSASALRDAPRTPDPPGRHPENCSPTLRPEASLTHIVLTPPGLDGADGVNVRILGNVRTVSGIEFHVVTPNISIGDALTLE